MEPEKLPIRVRRFSDQEEEMEEFQIAFRALLRGTSMPIYVLRTIVLEEIQDGTPVPLPRAEPDPNADEPDF